MTSPARVFAVLNLFSEERPVWHTDQINEALGYTRATGYRYVRDLVEADFLKKVSAGYYALGARIIELDYQLRRSDPVLLAALPVMKQLAKRSHLDVALTALLGTKVVDMHRTTGAAETELMWGRGRPRPLFRGAAPKVILANLPRAQLVRIYETHVAEVAAAQMGMTWTEFRAGLSAIRRQGFYLSHGELQANGGAAAVPLFGADGEVVAALALVGPIEELDKLGLDSLKKWLLKAAQTIGADLARVSSAGPAVETDALLLADVV